MWQKVLCQRAHQGLSCHYRRLGVWDRHLANPRWGLARWLHLSRLRVLEVQRADPGGNQQSACPQEEVQEGEENHDSGSTSYEWRVWKLGEAIVRSPCWDRRCQRDHRSVSWNLRRSQRTDPQSWSQDKSGNEREAQTWAWPPEIQEARETA